MQRATWYLIHNSNSLWCQCSKISGLSGQITPKQNASKTLSVVCVNVDERFCALTLFTVAFRVGVGFVSSGAAPASHLRASVMGLEGRKETGRAWLKQFRSDTMEVVKVAGQRNEKSDWRYDWGNAGSCPRSRVSISRCQVRCQRLYRKLHVCLLPVRVTWKQVRTDMVDY